MIYLDHGATSFPKLPRVRRAVTEAMERCANPGRGGHRPAMEAAQVVYECRERAAKLFECEPEQVVFTANCTQGLNMAIRTLVKPGSRVVISGYEHNAVTRPLHGIGAKITVAGRKLFDWADTLKEFDRALQAGQDAAVFTHVSNVFGYVLPIWQMAAMCRQRGVPFILDAAQSAGAIPLSLRQLGAAFIAMPGHKGLLGPQGTGILLCGRTPEPLILGGTGSDSKLQQMPDFLPDRGEAGTVNVPGIAGLSAGLGYILEQGAANIGRREQHLMSCCARGLKEQGYTVFSGPNQAGTVSFLAQGDCEEFAGELARKGIALRAGLHCAPLAHESAGTLDTGTVRVSFGWDGSMSQVQRLLRETAKLRPVDF